MNVLDSVAWTSSNMYVRFVSYALCVQRVPLWLRKIASIKPQPSGSLHGYDHADVQTSEGQASRLLVYWLGPGSWGSSVFDPWTASDHWPIVAWFCLVSIRKRMDP